VSEQGGIVLVLASARVGQAEVRSWTHGRAELSARIGPHVARREAQARARKDVRALLRPVERKHGWQLADIAGASTPYGVQHLLGRADWDGTRVRDELWGDGVAQLGDPAGVLLLAETSFPKQGAKSAGVTRQSCGSLGKRETCQGGVLLAYAGAGGCACIDRAWSLPKEGAGDPARRRAAGVPARVPLLPKPELGRRMRQRALAGGTPARWVRADEVDGGDDRLRACRADSEVDPV